MTTKEARPVRTKAFDLAMTILDLPVGPTSKELQRQARVYIRNLKPEDYEALKREALSEQGEYKDDYVDKLGIFKQILFTPRECQAYAGMRIDSPGVRKVIARRALLGAMRGWERIPKDMIHPDVIRMEDAFLSGMTEEDIMNRLQQIRRQRR